MVAGTTVLARSRRNPAAAWRHIDIALLSSVAALAALGVLMVFSATRSKGAFETVDTTFLRKQGLFVVVGSAVMAVTALIDYRRFRDFAWVIYGGAVLLLAVVVSPLGSSSKGAQAWFQVGSFQLQPSEIAKLALIIGLAAFTSQFQGDLDLRRLFAALLLAGMPLGLIMLQPDLGTGLVFVAITMGLLLVAGARGRHIAALTIVGVVGVVFVLNSGMLETYQKDRLTTFLNQDSETRGAAYNLAQSKIAIASGALAGKGLFHGTQTKLDYVPEQHTDFIFTVVGEELGFLGSATVLTLFAVITWRTWRTAQLARDPFGSYVCVGVLAMFVFQIFENVGMTMGIMPITGIPLPFLSYGGSSTLAEFAAMGLVLNVHMRRFT
jgi:rod shape determining protein RodA